MKTQQQPTTHANGRLVYGQAKDGSFVAGDCVTRRTAYAYPNSPNAAGMNDRCIYCDRPALTRCIICGRHICNGHDRFPHRLSHWSRHWQEFHIQAQEIRP